MDCTRTGKLYCRGRPLVSAEVMRGEGGSHYAQPTAPDPNSSSFVTSRLQSLRFKTSAHKKSA